MGDLKLGRLPDRTPVKLTIHVSPELGQALSDYADLYRERYGAAEPIAGLAAAMLEAFVEADRGFARWRKEVRK